MSRGHRSAWRRGDRGRRLARIAVGVGIPVAVIVIVGASLAVFDGKNLDSLSQAALGSCASSSASPPAAPDPGGSPAPDPGGSPAAADPGGSSAPTPCPTPSAPAASPAVAAGPRVAVAASSFANGPTATQLLGDLAWAPVDGQGNAINVNQTAAQAVASGNCTLIVPPHPLTARGLALPYQLADGCSEANPNLEAFVEATILSPDGQVQVYNPLIITEGTRPAAWPVRPRIPRGSQVILDFGFNGTNLLLTGPGAWKRSSGCVDALGQSVIGQVAACNAVRFYQLANTEIARGTLRIPAVGRALDGQACETVRNFALVDQDQSDNTYTHYLLAGDGQTGQDTAANVQYAMGGATTIANGSDNGLLGHFVDPANGCQPLSAPDITSPSGSQGSQALNELSARVNQAGPIAVVPTNDEMTQVGGAYSVAKTNVYRSLVDQPMLAADTNATEVAAAYCMNLVNMAPAHNQQDIGRDSGTASPVPATGNNLATFLGNRLSQSFTNLGCAAFGLTNPVNIKLDGNQVAIGGSYIIALQQATIPAPGTTTGGQAPASATATAPSQATAPSTVTIPGTVPSPATASSPGAAPAPAPGGRHHHHHMNPSGM